MRRIVVLMALCLSLTAAAQPKLQIISLNKDARTFVRGADGEWTLVDINTAINENTVFKNFSDPMSRVVIRDWSRNVQYELKLSQEELPLSAAINAKVTDSQRDNGKVGSFVVRAIKEEQVPALHYSRASAAISQRGTEQGEEMRQASAVLAGLASADNQFHIDSLSSVNAAYPVGMQRKGDDALILTNYSEDKTLYFSVYRITTRNNGKPLAKSLFGNNQYVMPPMTETLVSVSNEGRLVLIAAEEELCPAALSIKLERLEGRQPDGKEIIPSATVLLD